MATTRGSKKITYSEPKSYFNGAMRSAAKKAKAAKKTSTKKP